MPEAGLSDSDKKYLVALARHPDPVASTIEVAEGVGVTQQAAHHMLSKFEEQGWVKKKTVGSKAVVWWLTTDGRDVYATIDD